ncbi:hypothetical protein Pmi06nite_61710 [Planotetraspora mira]|uniref:Uncharacterized protein n=1 Tax=Planotetraspora mira TaxID=58121 RepID=A0A8J3TYD8_9ACTN|nr:hypothetical protein Pmi06nite_61710 [Planotetraspora mira]
MKVPTVPRGVDALRALLHGQAEAEKPAAAAQGVDALRAMLDGATQIRTATKVVPAPVAPVPLVLFQAPKLT